MDDDEVTYGWRIGKLQVGLHSHEEIISLARSFDATVVFLDAVKDGLKKVLTCFEFIHSQDEDQIYGFLKKPEVSSLVGTYFLESDLDCLIMAWQFASKHNPDVASFNGDTLGKLLEAIRNDADITNAFIAVDRELAKHLGRHELAEQIKGAEGHMLPAAEVAPVPPPPPSFLGLVFNSDLTVSRLGTEYRDILPIELSPQGLKLVRFIHDAGERGRTKNEIIPDIIAGSGILKSEKDRLKNDLIPLDLHLGPRSQYVLTCSKKPPVT